ncbi:LarC family nickel insertion protein [Neobacillus niacini]|uniref:LarC family nickel insertion protein n=1 Tax=Neobacillus niacini TaxID=86668 RepID=UPI0005EE101D|nr:LarC family nickel insertion protein [Neobacillus niacini]
MKTLYFDCFSGVSGDMVIGALIDAGADPNKLVEELKKLNIEDEYELTWKKVVKNGITSTKFDVLLDKHDHHHDHEHTHTHEHDHEHEHDHSHDHHHDHEHTHTHDHDHEYENVHVHTHDHQHDHEHTHDHDHHHHDHRSYKDIVRLIEEADFSQQVKDTALRIFKKIAEAEGLIHGVPLDNVHFHEVGAVDSIIDIIGTAILIDQLEISVIKSSPIPVGTGKIRIDHGIYPVPAPATLEILKGIPIEHSEVRAELATPTGAAIVSVLAEEFCSIPSMKVSSIGYGAGTKTFKDHPNVVRVIIGE